MAMRPGPHLPRFVLIALACCLLLCGCETAPDRGAVAAPAADEQNPEITDIFPPVAPPPPFALLLAAGGGVVAASALAFVLYRRRRRPNAAASPVPPHAAALAAIDRLVAEGGSQADSALFFSRLSLILRRYLEERFGLKAPEQTTEEFLAAMPDCPLFTEDQKELLSGFFRRADLIKFARLPPDRQEMAGSIERCRHFIAMTGNGNAANKECGQEEAR
jgi:hypothetical protein